MDRFWAGYFQIELDGFRIIVDPISPDTVAVAGEMNLFQFHAYHIDGDDTFNLFFYSHTNTWGKYVKDHAGEIVQKHRIHFTETDIGDFL